MCSARLATTLAVVAVSALAALGGAACKPKDAPAKNQAPVAADQPAHVAAVDTLDRLADIDPSTADSMKTIAGRLQFEAEHRPTDAIKAEAVFAALTKAGLPLTDGPRQYVGVIAGASYCVGGQTADGLGVSVCEYLSAAKAVEGKAAVEKRFAHLTPVRDIIVRGATTLTLTARPDAPLASSKRTATEAFATL